MLKDSKYPNVGALVTLKPDYLGTSTLIIELLVRFRGVL